MEDIYFTGILPVISDSVINITDISNFFHWKKRIQLNLDDIVTKVVIMEDNKNVKNIAYSKIWLRMLDNRKSIMA